jgi:outer membrane receptor protein involved in Fe transport
LGKPELRRIPGVNLDDRLRMVPGFSLFRRSSSLVANPTTQGVSLRGLGSSGASRTLVLFDGVPVNDPFGGWIQWNRFSPEQIERVEVMRGASTSVFGDRAMSGAIAMTSLSGERSRLYAGFEGGNLAQKLFSAGFAKPFRRMGVSANVRAFETDGYYIVPQSARGAADTTADTRFVSPDLRLDYFGDRQRMHLKADMLVEDRDNGTVLQRNSTSLGTVSAHYSGGTVNNVSLLGYHTREEFRAAFSTILAGRNSERLTFLQSVPADSTGGAFLFRRGQSRFNFTGGADAVRVEGYSIDSLVPTGKRIGGGTQVQHGVFGQASGMFGAAQLFGGVRRHEAGQGNTFISPSGGIVAGRKWIRGRASAYRSFRAPTLNELFREFRAGNAVTQPNDGLKPESSTGVEAGADFVFESRRLGITLFRNSLDDVITNVTLSSTPALIVRQRRNAEAAVSRGAEVEFRQRWRDFHGEVSYLFADTRFRSGPRIPQIARHQGSMQVGYVRGGTLATAGVRSFASQFEDDLNRFLLPGFAVAQFVVRQQLGKGLSAQAVVENLLDRSYVVGFSPTPNIGAPRMFRLGLRWDGFVR